MSVQFYDYAARMDGGEEGTIDPKIQPQWASVEDLAGLAAPEGRDNLWLADGLHLAFNPEDVERENMRNQHVLVIGASGAGKTRSFIIPNILKAPDCNVVAVDPKGEINRIAGDYLRAQGYDYRVINFVDPSMSDGYDPLYYVHSESDVDTLVEQLATLTLPGEGKESNKDYYWIMSKREMTRALVLCLFVCEKIDGAFAEGHDPDEPRKYLRMNRLLDLLELTDDLAGKDGNGSVTAMEHLISLMRNGGKTKKFDPVDVESAAKHWSTFVGLANTTYGCVRNDVMTTLGLFRSKDLRQMYDRSGPRLDKLDEGKQFIDIVISDNDSSRAPIVNMLIKNMLNQLQRKADASETGRLDRRVEMLLDEFPNIGAIHDFERIISTGRSRGINFLLVVQAIDQLDGVYGSFAREVIINNCDTFVYLGGGSSSKTAEWVSRACGEYAVATRCVGDEGVKVPDLSYVIRPSEVGVLDRNKCIVKVSGKRACLANKIDLWSNEQARKELNF